MGNRVIKAALFDFDDTIGRTRLVMKTVIDGVIDGIVTFYELDPLEFRRNFDVALLIAKNHHHLNPEPLWRATLAQLRIIYPQISAEVTVEALNEILKIYTSPVPIDEEAYELVCSFAKLGLKLALVTNASLEWTLIKLREPVVFAHSEQEYLPLIEYFSPQKGNLIVIEPHLKKTTEHWQQALNMVKCVPEETLVIGDSLTSDIIPAFDAGMIPVYKDGGTHWLSAEDAAAAAEYEGRPIIHIQAFGEFWEGLNRFRNNAQVFKLR